MKKKNNGFTLIELLAIIVILAIIAVITIPILLNVIENSRKGAATDSAYGYKDSVNKYYISELQNHNKLKLDGKYTVNSNGSLTPAEDNTFGFGDSEYGNSLNVAVSGTVPSSGILRYSNNVLNAGCLVIGDYKISFGTDGKVNGTEKGDCSDYEFPTSLPTMAEMCPGCKFGRTATQIGSSLPSGYSDDYTLYETPFLGQIVDNSTGNIIRSFVCGKEKNNYFCIEGYKSEKFSTNINILTSYLDDCYGDTSNYGCNTTDGGVSMNSYYISTYGEGDYSCTVNTDIDNNPNTPGVSECF